MTFLRSLARQYPGSQLARVVARHLAEAGAETALQPAPADTDPTPRSGERWAEVYGQSIGPCGARTRSGAPCRQPGVGCGGRCKFHGGASTGPRTAAGRARAALNGHAARRSQETMMLQTDLAQVAEATEAPVAALTAQAAAPDHEPVAPLASPAPRRPILEGLLDAHLSGQSRWPLAGRILAAIEGGPRPLTRAEVLAEVPEPGVDRVVGMLLARGVLNERAAGRRVVLDARASVRQDGAQAPRT
jgi:hypothetical protein